MDASPPVLNVRRLINTSQYGEVLECEMLGHNEPIAVKCISLSHAAKARSAALTREIDSPMQEQHVAALLISSGGHRNVVQHHFQFVHDRRLYLVNELCADGDLHSIVEARINASLLLEENEVLLIMQQILEGVFFLHETIGVAHRDLSLENVLMRGGVCKITNFGLSTDSRVTCASGWVGKEFYMAPEIVAGEMYNPALADIWSLGIMWFMMLTGSPLVSLASPSEKAFGCVVRHGIGAVIEIWGHSRRISRNTVSLLEKMLQAQPSERISLSQVLANPMFAIAAAE